MAPKAAVEDHLPMVDQEAERTEAFLGSLTPGLKWSGYESDRPNARDSEMVTLQSLAQIEFPLARRAMSAIDLHPQASVVHQVHLRRPISTSCRSAWYSLGDVSECLLIAGLALGEMDQ